MAAGVGLGIESLLLPKRSQILAIAEKHGAFNVRVFGSVARGEATAESDIDFLIDYDPNSRTPWFPMGLIHDWQALLGRDVDVATVEMLREDRGREQVLSEAVEL
ncbi:MAG: putative nucleotidyltransferase [Phormidesmis priestleyi Ana]|uniref:Putative nucleotidyltransferase n=1 Tax=Phormidesmis priestleyi Ana TaxID=1666911 RepID=A0A0P8D6H5_9CYAN|nr:MAG: putative nucleotidyltransferase [Phormidesmis priestleyi Ana]